MTTDLDAYDRSICGGMRVQSWFPVMSNIPVENWRYRIFERLDLTGINIYGVDMKLPGQQDGHAKTDIASPTTVTAMVAYLNQYDLSGER